MYPTLLPSKFSLSRLMTPRRPLLPAAQDYTSSDLPIRHQQFITTLNSALKDILPPDCRQWMLDTETHYGMLVNNLHLSLHHDGHNNRPPVVSSPLVAILFEPFTNPQVRITPRGDTPQEQADAAHLVASLRTAFLKHGKYSVVAVSAPHLVTAE